MAYPSTATSMTAAGASLQGLVEILAEGRRPHSGTTPNGNSVGQPNGNASRPGLGISGRG